MRRKLCREQSEPGDEGEGLELITLISIEDVTAVVNSAVKPEMSAADANTAGARQISAIEATRQRRPACAATSSRLSGRTVNLYRYKKYTDVRLVFVPEFQAAFFGGDSRQLSTFPRFNIDMALVRVSKKRSAGEDGQLFQVVQNRSEDGELVFVTGHPGSTQRLNTVGSSRSAARREAFHCCSACLSRVRKC